MSYNCSLNAIKESGKGATKGCPTWLLERLRREADLKFRVQPFRSVSDMCSKLNLPQSRFAQGWRLTNCVCGYIEGLPLSYGQLVATDGISCVIFQVGQQYNIAYIGHIAWFVEVDKLEDGEIRLKQPSAKRDKKTIKCFEGF